MNQRDQVLENSLEMSSNDGDAEANLEQEQEQEQEQDLGLGQAAPDSLNSEGSCSDDPASDQNFGAPSSPDHGPDVFSSNNSSNADISNTSSAGAASHNESSYDFEFQK
jgi:hypothetical protein